MKYVSDYTGKTYETANECMEADRKYAAEKKAEKEKKEKIVAERKTRAAEVEEARKAMVAAQSKYREVLEAFCKDYGTYHTSLTGEDAKKIIPTLFDIFNPLFL